MRHMITTIVPCEIATLFASTAAEALNQGTLKGAAALLAIANEIALATDKTYGLAREYQVSYYFRGRYDGDLPRSEQLPCVLLTVDEETRRTAGAAAGEVVRAIVRDRTAIDAVVVRDWCCYTLHDGCARPVFKI